ncbi:hypothetical protein SKAU_G00210600 [Synaphobranchus kaupii]|uniref:ribonuclease H n=1 Tax=Synaphobranchus kaupii TaxID=118154 RepID=A0A9Q1IV01_SYNKA|nr:hypothetical protein SKAU_G00210600 [Synaphobranchus kaupii]
MDRLLWEHREYAAAYLDDVVIHSHNWETHLSRLRAVLHSLQKAGLTANSKKCRLGQEEAEYLGFTIGRGGVRPQHKKNRDFTKNNQTNIVQRTTVAEQAFSWLKEALATPNFSRELVVQTDTSETGLDAVLV